MRTDRSPSPRAASTPRRPLCAPLASSLLVAAALVAAAFAAGCSPPAGHAATDSAAAGAAQPQPLDLQAVARNLVSAAMVKAGDKVLVTGSVRDATLLEHVAIEAMKVGGQPLIALGSESLTRRSFTDVPATYDTVTPGLDSGLVALFDVNISVDFGETEGLLADVPMARRAARSKASEPIMQALYQRNVRSVNLGNGQYPTPTLARRLGLGEGEVAASFWKGASVSPDSLRTRAEAMRAAAAAAPQLTLTHPNGTRLTVTVDPSRAIVSDGAITPEKAQRGTAAASTWLPAGELILPAVAGTAEGRVVIDHLLFDGKEIRGLTLTYSKGRLTGMTAASDMAALRAAYDAAGGGKDQFAFVDVGLNPETRLPAGKGRIVWTAPGAVTVGLGDNRGFGGTNASDFALAMQLAGATVRAGATTLVENGTLSQRVSTR